MPFDVRRIVGISGIGTLVVGTFYPMIYGNRFLEVKSFWSWGGDFDWGENWDGAVVIAMAVLAAALVWKEKYRWLLPIGACVLYLIRAAYIEFHRIQARAAELHAAALRDGLKDEMWGEVDLDLGLWIMAAGAVLLIVASLMPSWLSSRMGGRIEIV